MGSNGGEDWNAAVNGYSLMQVCFYTSSSLFSVETWKSTSSKSQCYFFEIDNYVSQFKGAKLKSFYLNGYSTSIYGWIDGPYVTDNVYFYHQVPLFTYTKQPAIIIELGTTAGSFGQDFNVFSPSAGESGDYYGTLVTNMAKDVTVNGGYENSGLSLQQWNAVPASQIAGLTFTALRVNFNRNISTFDSFDRTLQSTFIFCMLSYHYPRISMPIKLYEGMMTILMTMMMAVFITIITM